MADAVGPAGALSVKDSTAQHQARPGAVPAADGGAALRLSGQVILARPLLIALKAVPIILQSFGIFALGYAWAWSWKLPPKVAAPCALIGTPNFLELAVAVATGLFGLNSGAALASVAGVFVEVPVMLLLVAFANRRRGSSPA